MEAALMRRTMAPDAFADWFDAFLPQLSERQPATLFQPASVSDRSRRQDRPSGRPEPEPRLVLA
jgi:hypothetical protein